MLYLHNQNIIIKTKMKKQITFVLLFACMVSLGWSQTVLSNKGKDFYMGFPANFCYAGSCSATIELSALGCVDAPKRVARLRPTELTPRWTS